MDFYNIIFQAHSGLRWLVLLAAVITIIKLLMTWLQKGSFGKGDQRLTRIFVSLLDLQFILGLSLVLYFLINAGALAGYQIEHAVTNLIAISLVHFAAKWKGSPGPVRARNTLITYLIAFLLIGLSISRLPQGWSMGG